MWRVMVWCVVLSGRPPTPRPTPPPPPPPHPPPPPSLSNPRNPPRNHPPDPAPPWAAGCAGMKAASDPICGGIRVMCAGEFMRVGWGRVGGGGSGWGGRGGGGGEGRGGGGCLGALVACMVVAGDAGVARDETGSFAAEGASC